MAQLDAPSINATEIYYVDEINTAETATPILHNILGFAYSSVENIAESIADKYDVVHKTNGHPMFTSDSTIRAYALLLSECDLLIDCNFNKSEVQARIDAFVTEHAVAVCADGRVIAAARIDGDDICFTNHS